MPIYCLGHLIPNDGEFKSLLLHHFSCFNQRAINELTCGAPPHVTWVAAKASSDPVGSNRTEQSWSRCRG